jgi:hypothetical protein
LKRQPPSISKRLSQPFIIVLLAALILLPLFVALAQEPSATENASSNPQGNAAPTQAVAPQAQPTAAPATPNPNDPLPLLVSARSDLELLATATLGSKRPTGWNGSLDINNPQLAILIRLDLELLAGELLGADKRPLGWFGAVPTTPFGIARDIRHDLELLADQVVQPNVRPPGWSGADPLMRCNRALQNLVGLLERGGVFTLQVDPNAPDFCQKAEVQASQFTETNLLSKPAGSNPFAASAPTGPVVVNSKFAVAFLDTGASLRVGIIPNGTPITPVARSYSQFSRMMLVSGDGFEVFVDYGFTNVTEAQFKALPDVAKTENNPTCSADWCVAE